MKLAILSLFLTVAFAGCTSTNVAYAPTAQQEEESRHLQALSAASRKCVVDASDGISEVEAYKIAHDYFRTKNGNGCGMVCIPKAEGIVWRVPILEGLAPVHTKDVLIDRATGTYRVEAIQKPDQPNKSPEPIRASASRRPSGLI
jgi:hypothetical protein